MEYKKYLETGKSVSQNVFEFLRNYDYARLAYFPFIGWIYPFAARSGDGFFYFHAKQALVTAVIFSAFPAALTVLIFFSPSEIKLIRLILTLVIYLSHLVYFGLCGWGSYMISKGVREDFPVVEKFAGSIEI